VALLPVGAGVKAALSVSAIEGNPSRHDLVRINLTPCTFSKSGISARMAQLFHGNKPQSHQVFVPISLPIWISQMNNHGKWHPQCPKLPPFLFFRLWYQLQRQICLFTGFSQAFGFYRISANIDPALSVFVPIR